MKKFKLLFALLLIVTISSCDSDDDGDSIPSQGDFTASINGGTFNNFEFELGEVGSVNGSGFEGRLTITAFDTNDTNVANIITLFINSTGGLSSGTQAVIGSPDDQGFINNATIRDQANQVTYVSVEGSITILENVIDSQDEDISVVTGNFDIILNPETSSEIVTMTGTFENIRFIN